MCVSEKVSRRELQLLSLSKLRVAFIVVLAQQKQQQ